MNGGVSAFEDTVDFGFAHDQQFFTIDLVRAAAGVRAEHYLVTYLNGRGPPFTVAQETPGTKSDHHTGVRFFCCRARQNDTASGFGFYFASTNDYAIVSRPDFHRCECPDCK